MTWYDWSSFYYNSNSSPILTTDKPHNIFIFISLANQPAYLSQFQLLSSLILLLRHHHRLYSTGFSTIPYIHITNFKITEFYQCWLRDCKSWNELQNFFFTILPTQQKYLILFFHWKRLKVWSKKPQCLELKRKSSNRFYQNRRKETSSFLQSSIMYYSFPFDVLYVVCEARLRIGATQMKAFNNIIITYYWRWLKYYYLRLQWTQ